MNRTTVGAPVTEGRGSGEVNPGRRRGYLVIVARDRPDLLRHLRKALADWPDAEVVSDRRYGARWQWGQSRESPQRGVERRRPLSRETDVHSRAFLIVPRRDPQH